MEDNNFQIESIYDLDEKQKKIKKQKNVSIDVQGTKYDLIREVSRNFEWNIIEQKNKDDYKIWNLRWFDFYINEEELRKMLPFQKINHFPGSQSLGKKNNLAQNLLKMQKLFPNDYNYFPKTWILPFQFEDLKSFFYNKDINQNNKTMIVKPEAMCQGKGIFLLKQIELLNPQNHMIVQQYINDPYLIDDLKFDCRLYVLIKNLNPLKIFLYKDGIARFATIPYKIPKYKNINNQYMHLTNYAIQKTSIQFQNNAYDHYKNEENGHKRSFSSILKIIQKRGGNVQILMNKIQQLIVKTVSSVQPSMFHSYKSSRPKDEQLELCFEILGFDIIIDQNITPWLIEVNHTPSFQTDSDLDYLIKKNMIQDTLILLDISNKDKKIYNELNKSMSISALSKQIMFKNRQQDLVEQFENQNLNGYIKCYPCEDKNFNQQVQEFINGANQILNKWSGPKFKKEIVQEKQVILEIPKKIKKLTKNIKKTSESEAQSMIDQEQNDENNSNSQNLDRFSKYITQNYMHKFTKQQIEEYKDKMIYMFNKDEKSYQQKLDILEKQQQFKKQGTLVKSQQSMQDIQKIIQQNLAIEKQQQLLFQFSQKQDFLPNVNKIQNDQNIIYHKKKDQMSLTPINKNAAQSQRSLRIIENQSQEDYSLFYQKRYLINKKQVSRDVTQQLNLQILQQQQLLFKQSLYEISNQNRQNTVIQNNLFTNSFQNNFNRKQNDNIKKQNKKHIIFYKNDRIQNFKEIVQYKSKQCSKDQIPINSQFSIRGQKLFKSQQKNLEIKKINLNEE